MRTRFFRAPAVYPLLLLLLALGACGGGGGGGGGGSASAPGQSFGASEMAVLIAQADASSEAIGLAYQKARGIADAQMIRVPVPSGSDTISAADFATLKAALDARLPATAQATLVTWTQPSRVVGACVMSLTSALAFGYDPAYCGVGGVPNNAGGGLVSCNQTPTSAYYNSDSRRPWTDLGIRPSMMLGAATLADAQTLIARGIAADASLAGGSPVAQAWLVRTSDVARNVRWPDFQALAAALVAGVSLHYVDNASGSGSDLVVGQGDVMFYLTGLASVAQAAANRYLPGAIADTLTSYGGMLPSGNGQMPVTDWLRAGATASYGAVDEPCNYSEKFARASVLVSRYRRGETLIEAYWKSVQWPGQGLFVGEPLAHPW